MYLLVEAGVFLANMLSLPLWLIYIRIGSNWEKLFKPRFEEVTYFETVQLICKKLEQYCNEDRPKFSDLVDKEWLLLMRDNRFALKVTPTKYGDTLIEYNKANKEYDLGEVTSKEWLETWTNVDVEEIEKIKLEQLIDIDITELATENYAKVTQIFM